MPIKQSSSRANKKQKSACGDSVRQQCHCGQSSREIECGQDVTKKYNCGKQCGKKLDCGKHFCESTCHPMPCQPCPLLPSQVQFCPCGKTPLSSKTCFDHVQTCDRSCGKVLPCSTPDNKHICRSNCHVGPCPPCEKTRRATCICGETSRVDCKDVNEDGSYVCQTPCNKKLKCGRHNCMEPECQCRSFHECNLVCNRMLQCGIHKCVGKCHKGPCKPCSEISNEKLTCHCGSEVIEPPRKCGAPPPTCTKPCAREHMCDHESHTCHNGEECPPCTFLTDKTCIGGHKTLSDIPCYETHVSCGVICGKPLSCVNHTCQKKCHGGECLESGEHCRQPCQISRKDCGHTCGRPCHVGSDCTDNDSQCCVKTCMAGHKILLTCKCGRMEKSIKCTGNEPGASLPNEPKEKLECGIMCSQELLNLAKITGKFSIHVENKIKKFVLKVQKVQKGSYSQRHELRFEPMEARERKMIHLLAPCYGCESKSNGIGSERYTTIYTTRSNARQPNPSLKDVVLEKSV